MALYHLDPLPLIWAQDIGPVLVLLDRLRFEERSLYRASSLGNEQLFGWSEQTHLLTAIANALHTQLKGKKLSPSQRITPPAPKKKRPPAYKPQGPVALMDLSRLLPPAS